MCKFKVGDRVRPKSWVERSYYVNMFHEETGVVVGIDSNCLLVKRESDGEGFAAHEMYWEEA